ncbi:MAG: DUF885 domain-containing protein [Pacificimonas sp.]|jgi:uncharacterized protein (DUF885 family)|nr:DUF885 domain-containing protein [Pacificimonas sp.]
MMIRLLLSTAAATALSACAATYDAPVTATTAASTTPAMPEEAMSEAEMSADARLSAFFEEYDEAVLARNPLSKSYRGIVDEDYGRWGDWSDEAAIAAREEDERFLARMRAEFASADLSAQSRDSYRLFEAMMQRSAAAFPFRRNAYVFDQMNGAHAQLPAFLINIHRVRDVDQARAYISRLQGMGGVIDTLIEEAAIRTAAGVQPPDWVYPYLLSDVDNLLSGAPFTDGEPTALLADFTAKANGLDIPEAEKAALIAEGRQALTEIVGPAYRRLRTAIATEQATAPTVDGIHRFADGSAYYNERLRYYTTTDMTAEEVHNLGLREVARIHSEMQAIMNEVGFTGTRPEFFEKLRTDPAMFHTSREDYLAEVQVVTDRMAERLPQYFGTLPKSDFIVKPVEAFREKSAGKAFYQSPSPDGSRPGTYYVNLYNLNDMSKTELEALAYHEAMPGHHLQRALQVEMEGLPAFRRFGGFTAYTEGWGLYSEELGKDMGFYTDPYSDFGRLGMELWRACRLVVDTGLHSKGWSRERAIQYLKDNTPNPDGDIRKAIERYAVYPGQATAYTIGKQKIMDLRAEAMETLGDDFDWRGFHDAILATGPVPLSILEENIDAWVARQAG